MDELMKLILTGGGSAVVTGAIVALLFREREKRRDNAEHEVEETRKAFQKAVVERLDLVSAKVDQVHSDSRISTERWTSMQASTAALLERINGISATHGPKLEDHGQTLARHDERLRMLERGRP
jgi:hypothetical protein